MSTLSYSAILSERSQKGRELTAPTTAPPKFCVRNLDFWYDAQQALHTISLVIADCSVLALIGPSGCGKSTFLRTLNRMNDLIDGVRISGKTLLDGKEIYSKQANAFELRKRVGMVFQKSNPFPKSVFENVAYGPRIGGIRDRA